MADEATTESTTASEGAAAATADEAEPNLGDAGKKALAEERKAKREAEKRAVELESRLKQFEDRDKTEAQKLAERAETAEKQYADAQRELLRLRVLSEVSLPADLHEFVVGNDEDELRAKAQKLAAQFSAGQRSVDVGQGPRGTSSAPDMSQLIRQAAGRA